ncbi:MATE family efflux transporter [uncultured Methanobrevibacter sp.]|uniref:MATE family efflux transporter n=1 Tax=uncultured Methanobrevibacter sp. TaxID=253161 RepID=UPI00261D0DD0|nr:MATE family efflux transporter [uncultured Methanobrevibacter sp.]
MNLLSNDNKLLNSVFKNFLFGTVFSVVCTILGIILNGILIGNFFGKIGLAAAGLTMPIIYGYLTIAYVFAYGGSIVASNHMADEKRVNNNFSVTCIVAAIVGIILTILLLLFSTDVVQILGASGESFNATVSLMKGLSLATLPAMFLYIFVNYSRIDGYPLLGLYAGLILFLSNLILDLAFVLILKTDIFGVGLATALSAIITVLFLLMHFLSKKSSYKFHKKPEFKPELYEIIKTGLPSALNQVYNMLRTIITNNLGAIVGGVIFVGALSVQSNVYLLLCSIGVGIGTTTLALGGIFYGEKDKTHLEQLLGLSIKYALILVSITAVILYIFAPYFVYAFGNNPDVYGTAIRGIRIFAWSLPLSGLCYVFLNFYNATQQLKIANYIGFAHSFLFLSAFSTMFAFLIGGDGIWISFVLCEIVTLLSLPFIIKLKIKKFPKSLKDFVIIDEDQFPSEDTYVAYIESEDELMDIVENLDEKLYDNNLDDKTKLKIELILEEMGKNIFTHAYKSNENKYINIRIRYKNTEEVIVYFQDNGVPFDIGKDYLEKKEFHGIKIIKNFSEDINYNHNIKLNNNKIVIPKKINL